MKVKLKSTEIVKRINKIFGDQIADSDWVGDIRLHYIGTVDGKEVQIDDWILCNEEFYMYVYYNPNIHELTTHTYPDDPDFIPEEDDEYCINNNNSRKLAHSSYDGKNYYWEFDEEQLVNIVESLRDFFGLSKSAPLLISDDDMVI